MRATNLSHEKPRLGEGVYTSTDASTILDIDKRRIKHLINYYSKNKFSELADYDYVYNSGGRNFINFYGLIELKVFDELRKENVPTNKIIQAYKMYSKEYNTNYPFAKKQVLLLGKTILMEIGGNYLNTSGEKTIMIPKIIQDFAKKIEFSEDGMALRFYPLGKDKSVVVDPKHQFGTPTIKDTNIKATTISEMHNAGDSVKVLSILFNLEENSVRDAITYGNRMAS